MGLDDVTFWGQMAAKVMHFGLDRLGARTCATKGHKWRDVGAIVLREDGGVEQLARGAMQRCGRCGETRAKPAE